MSEKLRKAVLDHNYPRLLGWAVVIVFFGMIAVAMVQACVPYPPIPAAPPTIAPTITQAAPITHIPTNTLTPFPDTATWTPTASYSPTTTPTSTATSSPTATVEPSASPTPTLPLMPHTGASAEELTRIAETATVTATDQPTGTPAPSATVSSEIEPPPLPVCAVKWKVVYYHWEAGEWTMKLRCPMVTPKPEAGV